MNRRHLIKLGSLGAGSLLTASLPGQQQTPAARKPLVLSTWEAGINANQAAWKVLKSKGRALDAVEAGVRITEAEISCCVGLGGYPDREGIVTLDACIMDEHGNAGSVAFLERIQHPVSVARRVMEKTPHVMLVGEGAQQFALAEGFPLEEQKLSDSAKEAYHKWLEQSKYKAGDINHDTIGMVAIDAAGNLSGSCTTSGLAFKMRGRVGDSPIIGAGLFVDNEVGAAAATGVGEEVIKICGTHLVVEAMRHGSSPEAACKLAVEKIKSRHTTQELKSIQVAFIALNKQGAYGAYAILPGFSYAVCYSDDNNHLVDGKHLI